MTVFHKIGPYHIVRQIGRGMSPVFLATDSRTDATVALKVVPVGSDDEALEILEAEQQGAHLQRRFSELTQYVPRVYEIDRAADYFYIAMQYIDGEDLSAVLSRGPIAAERAVGIATQLCHFLEEVDRVAGEEGESAVTLLHNDIKPGNIRLEAGDRVKILDFGASKVISLSKRVTRNVFGSIPYLSPECLETGRRDRHTDAWALGVLLYEMVAGRPPFRADTTVNLERRIRSREQPEPAPGVPVALQSVIAKLLAPFPGGRYDNPRAIRADLEAVASGELTVAEHEGRTRPASSGDVAATRRTRLPQAGDETSHVEVASENAAAVASSMHDVATRRTSNPVTEAAVTRVVDPSVAGPAVERAAPPAVPVAGARPRRRLGQRLITAAVVVAIAIVGNELLIARRAGQVAASVPLQEFAGLNSAWTQYGSLAGRSYLAGMGTSELARALVRQSQVLADRVIGNYRSPTPTVREAQWESAASVLRRALTIEPGNADMRGALRYVEGQLHRIDGEAFKSRRQTTQAQRELAEAVSAFREAAALRPDWPDPHLGLARTFIYGIEDIDRGADAISQAQTLGYATGARETSQLGDGYRTRGETLQRAAESLAGLPQEQESLARAAEAYRRALELYSKISDFADVPARIRMTQARLAVVEQKLARASATPVAVDDTKGSTINRLIDAISGAF